MTPFANDQWIMLVLVFVLGLFIGMFMTAGRSWRRRYEQERARAQALAADNDRLHREAREMESLRHAAAKSPPRDPAEVPPPPPERPLA